MTAGAALAASLAAPRLRAEPVLTDDGLYRQPWFLESFLELADDLAGAQPTAASASPSCGNCAAAPIAAKRIWSISRAPDIEDYIKANFDILQLNIIGARKVTDFDGSEISEKALAAKYGVRFTPTLQFFPESAAGLGEQSPDKREVARAPGYLRPDDFLALFRFVREKGYETKSFRDYLRRERGSSSS